MYRLIIVDDEDWIRERLKHTVDWGRMGIEVIGEASDGEEALEMTERLLPDIVITDIRMPCIDGLEYIKRIRDSRNDVKVIIISGYSDFEYARKAIKLGAFDYILKPVEDENLTGVMERCIEAIDTEKSKELLFSKAREQIKESLPVLKKEFLINLVNDYFNSDADILKEFSYLDIHFVSRSNICFILELDGADPEDSSDLWDKRLIQFVMCNIAQDFLAKLGHNECFFSQIGEVICLVFSDAEESVLTRRVLSVSNGIRKMIKRITDHSVTIGIGRACGSISGIPASYREAGEALQYKLYLGSDRIYDIRSIGDEHRPNRYKPNDLETLLNNIKMGNKEQALSTLDALIKRVYRENPEICPLDLKLLYMDIINSVNKIVIEVNSSIEEFSSFSIRFFKQLNRLQTIEEIHDWLSDAVVRIIDILAKYKSTRKRKVIEMAVRYVGEHYNEPITLNSVADRFYMNESYFCKVFKEEMGVSFTRYLINLRIQKATELMADPTVKIYELAAMVGYEDVQYFTKIFKSVQGVTPVQYREKIK